MTDWAAEAVQQWELLVVVLAMALKLWRLDRDVKRLSR